MNQSSCVFCRILAGEIAAKVIERNNHAVAILDAFPLAAGHSLVVGTSHIAKVQDVDSGEWQGVLNLVHRIVPAIEKATGAPSTTIAIHNGKEAGQEIPHLHVHVIPRRQGDGAGPVHSMFRQRPESSSLDMEAIRNEIASQLS